jgi:peptidoglycan/LPS O-acetylase OafA/YrhL
MKIELLGSFARYVIYGLLFGRDRIAVIAALGVMSFAHIINTAYLGFVFGAFMRDLWAAGSKPVYPFALFLAGILLGFPAHGFLERVGFQRVPTIFALGENESAFASIAAALIVQGALYSRMGELFSSPPCQFLGKISFPLYLIHVPLLYTALQLSTWLLRPSPAQRFRNLCTLSCSQPLHFVAGRKGSGRSNFGGHRVHPNEVPDTAKPHACCPANVRATKDGLEACSI